MKEQDSPLIPDFTLEIACGLAGIVETSWVKNMVENSMRAWLKLRGIQPHKKMYLIETIQSHLNREYDQKYVEQLHIFFIAIGDVKITEQLENILEQWRKAKLKEIIF